MNPFSPPVEKTYPPAASSHRMGVATVLTLTACLLYLDRYAASIAAKAIKADLGMTDAQFNDYQSFFFWSYALCQIPAGWFSDRLGPRRVLTLYIVGWSLVTALTGVVSSVGQALLLRFLCGMAQAGAYPVCSGMIRVWFPLERRGKISSIVALGGRAGAVLAPVLTAGLMTYLGMGWRAVLISYGIAGIAVAVACYVVCRDKPDDYVPDPGKHASEFLSQNGFEGTKKNASTVAAAGFPLGAALGSLSLWGNSLLQFFTNIGWLFVVTLLPQYLDEVHKVPLVEQALMTALPTIAGIIGMFCGGWYTDIAARHFGLKWARRLPVLTTRFGATLGFALCIIPGQFYADQPAPAWLPWMVIGSLSFATLCSDLGIPAIWAYAQDVGGPYTASIMGWSNMFGNLGAAVAPKIYTVLLGETPTIAEWDTLFITCSLMFAMAGVCSLALDSSKPISAGKDV